MCIVLQRIASNRPGAHRPEHYPGFGMKPQMGNQGLIKSVSTRRKDHEIRRNQTIGGRLQRMHELARYVLS